jgi:hypothetical protein
MTDAGTELWNAGGCRCGLVRFRAQGAPFRVGVCHCESCRRATGAAFATYVDYLEDKVTIEGAAAVWSSTPGVERLFCPRCGSPIAFRDQDEPRLMCLHLGAFDAPEPFTPHHVTHAEEGFDWAKRALAPVLGGGAA